MIVCDTGQLVAAAGPQPTCTDLFTGLHLARRQILVRAPVVAEVDYLLGRAGGARIEVGFLRSIVEHTFSVVDLTDNDYARMAELVETYADFPLGTTNAAVIAVAERLRITEVATLDHRYFRAVRPLRVDALTPLP